MEPQLPNPNFGGETPALDNKKPEVVSSPRPAGLEVKPSQPIEELRSIESHEQKHGAVNNATSPAGSLPIVIPQPVAADDTTVLSLGQAATLASNDDVIEKEWVTKSKRIVKETKGDPYRKEHEVSKLQADYMKKRYGKEVKVPDDI